jgi:hypothetical protein
MSSAAVIFNTVVILQTPDDPMHQINLGLWVHLLQAIFHDLKLFLETAKRQSGSSYFGKSKQEAVWTRCKLVFGINLLIEQFGY